MRWDPKEIFEMGLKLFPISILGQGGKGFTPVIRAYDGDLPIGSGWLKISATPVPRITLPSNSPPWIITSRYSATILFSDSSPFLQHLSIGWGLFPRGLEEFGLQGGVIRGTPYLILDRRER
jgi:hypothetical protein